MKYTKGKWELNPKNKQMVIIKGKKGFLQTPQHPEFIIVQTSLYTSPEHDECLANARLIASAPELYEALNEILNNTMFADDMPKLGWDLWRKKAVRAINKAEGG